MNSDLEKIKLAYLIGKLYACRCRKSLGPFWNTILLNRYSTTAGTLRYTETKCLNDAPITCCGNRTPVVFLEFEFWSYLQSHMSVPLCHRMSKPPRAISIWKAVYHLQAGWMASAHTSEYWIKVQSSQIAWNGSACSAYSIRSIQAMKADVWELIKNRANILRNPIRCTDTTVQSSSGIFPNS